MNAIRPPPRQTVSEWAEAERRLSSESASEPGRWSNDRAAYQREMMDVVNDPLISDVTIMSSAQVGKTEVVNNIAGFFIDRDPAPMLVILPTLDLGRSWSKDRLAPMVRDTPALTSKLGEAGKRTRSDETILHKRFDGGHLTIAGANSPASLSSRPVRILLGDEVDRFPASAGDEGDPLKLGHKRTTTFHNAVRVDTSTPTIEGFSRISTRYRQSDMRKYFVPCPHCGGFQVLAWANVIFGSDGNNQERAETAAYLCRFDALEVDSEGVENKVPAGCGALWTESEKRQAVRGGEWRSTNPEGNPSHAGFHIWEIYSPWSSMRAIVEAFLESKDDPLTLQVWTNTCLGETFEASGETLEETDLANRRESYGAEVPNDVLLLTAGVDIQADRIECEAVGWVDDETTYGIDYKVIRGDTEADPVWTELDDWLSKTWRRADGLPLGLTAVGVDSGHRTATVYDFCRERADRRVWAMKGQGGDGVPLIRAPTPKKTSGNRRVDLYMIGVDEAKTTIYARLRVKDGKPKRCHFPDHYPSDYFEGLTAERKVRTFHKGFPKFEWRKAPGKPNEPLDLRVYGLAALRILNPVWPAIRKRIDSAASRNSATDADETPKPKRKRRARRRGFVGGFSK